MGKPRFRGHLLAVVSLCTSFCMLSAVVVWQSPLAEASVIGLHPILKLSGEFWVGHSYLAIVRISGGKPPYGLCTPPGETPPGLTASIIGDHLLLAGVPTQAGVSNWAACVKDNAFGSTSGDQGYQLYTMEFVDRSRTILKIDRSLAPCVLPGECAFSAKVLPETPGSGWPMGPAGLEVISGNENSSFGEPAPISPGCHCAVWSAYLLGPNTLFADFLSQDGIPTPGWPNPYEKSFSLSLRVDVPDPPVYEALIAAAKEERMINLHEDLRNETLRADFVADATNAAADLQQARNELPSPTEVIPADRPRLVGVIKDALSSATMMMQVSEDIDLDKSRAGYAPELTGAENDTAAAEAEVM